MANADAQNHTLLQSVTDYVIAINRNYQIILSNDLFKEKFGIPSDGQCFKVLKKRDVKCENCLVERSFQDGQEHWGEEKLILNDGCVVPMLLKATPVKNDRGEILFAIETATDITKKENLQKALKKVTGSLEEIIGERLRGLQKSEAKYRTIFERSLDAILLTDSKGSILEVNQAGVEMLGYEKKGQILALGSAREIFENPRDHHRFTQKLSQNGFVKEFETSLNTKDGRTLHTLLTSNVVLDVEGPITGYALIIRDITKKKHAQEEIEKRSNRLAILNDIAMTVSSSLDLGEVLNRTIDKILEIVEPDSVRIYLLDKEEKDLNLSAHKGLAEDFITKPFIRSRAVGAGFLGKTVLNGKTRVVDNLQAFDDSYADTIAKEGLKSTIYIPLISKGKSVGVMCVSSHTHFRLSSGYVAFLTAVGNQIGLAIDNANLYEHINKAYEKLKHAQEQVLRSEKLASLGKLAATFAHEINNPLAAVLTYTKLMLKLLHRKRFTGERLDDVERYLNTMARETARCGEIVKNLLTFSRQSKMTIESHCIEEIIDKTLSLIDHDLKLKEIQLVKKIGKGLPTVRCDAKQIQQVLLNLVSNAAEAMTKNGILTATAQRAKRDDFIEIAVSDTGRGIPKEHLKSIFEPFFTTKEEGKGVGLGLSVAYGIITRHNGAIEVESRPERGSTFRVLLPVGQRDQQQTPGPT